jgi:putative exporter of polyketide antibiotics
VAGVDERAGVVCAVAGGALGAGFVVRMFAEIEEPLLSWK